jgi:hypothetical protein
VVSPPAAMSDDDFIARHVLPNVPPSWFIDVAVIAAAFQSPINACAAVNAGTLTGYADDPPRRQLSEVDFSHATVVALDASLAAIADANNACHGSELVKLMGRGLTVSASQALWATHLAHCAHALTHSLAHARIFNCAAQVRNDVWKQANARELGDRGLDDRVEMTAHDGGLRADTTLCDQRCQCRCVDDRHDTGCAFTCTGLFAVYHSRKGYVQTLTAAESKLRCAGDERGGQAVLVCSVRAGTVVLQAHGDVRPRHSVFSVGDRISLAVASTSC